MFNTKFGKQMANNFIYKQARQMKTHNIKYFLFWALLLMLFQYSKAQQVMLSLKNGSEIKGKLISIDTSAVSLDPDGQVSFLKISTGKLDSLTILKTGKVLYFPIEDYQIPKDIKLSSKKNALKVPDNSYFNNYYGMYFFGGFSSEKTIDHYQTIPFIYKNGGFGGLGVEYLYDTPNSNIDMLVDYEIALMEAKMLTVLNGEKKELMKGSNFTMDVDFNVYPFQVRVKKYPTPFAFAGLGIRIITMNSSNSSGTSGEVHGAIPFGLGVRWQLFDGVALQIKERFVYSKLKEVNSFVLPETRFELHFDIGKW